MNDMRLSEDGKVFLKRQEGLVLKVISDVGHPSIGYGHNQLPGENFKEITLEKAEELFDSDVKKFEAAVNSVVHVQLLQHQFDALVSFAFNIGAFAFCHVGAGGSPCTLVQKLNAGDYLGATAEFSRWIYVRGLEESPLLRARRKREADLFFLGRY